MIREDLGFDVEFERTLGREVEHLFERGHPCAGNRLLFGERRILDLAAVPLLHFSERQCVDGDFGLGSRTYRRMQDRIVRHDNNAVLGDGHVQLKHIDARGYGVFKRWNRVLRPHGARAAMAVDFYVMSWVGSHKYAN